MLLNTMKKKSFNKLVLCTKQKFLNIKKKVIKSSLFLDFQYAQNKSSYILKKKKFRIV